MKCPEVDCIPGSWHDAWSKYLPTRPGWYWFRDMENDESIHMIHVVIRRGRLQGVFHSSEDIHKVYADWIELWDGEWIEAKLPLLLGERLQVAYDKEAGFDANLINRLNDENKRLKDGIGDVLSAINNVDPGECSEDAYEWLEAAREDMLNALKGEQ